ncbi:MAG TPA: apolipoprotein N-acyltransferase [Streptosporangiaceae bacterium]|nr:apolipoprotein N-acyltransferase [Streptosporangiaceae bacterium]
MAVWRGLTKPIRYAVLLAGALPVLAFPAANLEFLAWLGLVPGLLIMRASPSAREAAVRGWWFGAGFILAAHYWLTPNIGPALLLVAIVLGALWIPVAVSTWLLLRPPASPGRDRIAGVGAARAATALLVVPSWWLVIEWIRSWQALGGPWALLGVSQWQHPAVLGLAAVGGVWLVSFAIVAANTGIVILLTGGRPAIRALGAAAAAVAVAAGPTAFALSPPPHPTRFLTVALVQPGINPGPGASQRLSAGLGSRHPGLIVWGESSVDSDLATSPGLRARLAALSAADGAQILADQDTVIGGKKSKTAVLLGPRGIAATYTKTRLVPFGEYIPFRQQLGWLTRISRAAPVNMVPGTGAKTMLITTPGGSRVSIGVLICFESAFPDMSRVDARRGAQLIAYQTSDSTFQLTWAPAQHASLGAVRAAETGRPVVQAALTGDSVAYDAQGRLLAALSTGQRGILVVRLGLAPAAALTPFDRIGDVVPWAAIGIALLSVLLLISTRRPHHPLAIELDVNLRPVQSVLIQGTLTDRTAGSGPTGRDEGSASSSQSGQ